MKALILIIAFIAIAVALRISDVVGYQEKDNPKESGKDRSKAPVKRVPKINITKVEELKEALKFYKGLAE